MKVMGWRVQERVSFWVLEATAGLAKEMNVTDKGTRPGSIRQQSGQSEKESQVFRSAKEGMVFLQVDVHHLLILTKAPRGILIPILQINSEKLREVKLYA